jgi:hypothetical protein
MLGTNIIKKRLHRYKNKMKILIYTNCQGWAIKETLGVDPQMHTTTYIPCHDTDIINDEFTKLVRESDIIITQPIRDNYREKTYLSTSYIIENAKHDCKIILFDSCHFEFYHFDLTYKWSNGSIFDKPCHYHYNGVIDTYRKKLPIQHYIDQYVNNPLLKSREELEELARSSLAELKRRYEKSCDNYGKNSNVTIISTHDYIRDNYKDKLLFYSMNHPTKHLIQYICKEIRNMLPISCNINYSIDTLDNYRGILYKCLQSAVNFKIEDHTSLTLSKTSVSDIAKIYYDAYDIVGDADMAMVK